MIQLVALYGVGVLIVGGLYLWTFTSDIFAKNNYEKNMDDLRIKEKTKIKPQSIPCCYTRQELQRLLDERAQDAIKGNGLTHEDVLQLTKRWE